MEQIMNNKKSPLDAPIQPISWIKTIELGYSIVEGPSRKVVCFSCGRSNDNDNEQKTLLKCAKCKIASYCNKECQIKDWKKGGHKISCDTYLRVGQDMNITNEQDKINAKKEIFGRIRFYVCPYAVYKLTKLGKGFLFIQTDKTLAIMSLGQPKDCYGLSTGMRSVLVHYLTLGEYDHEVCRDDFEMTILRNELYKAVNEQYDVEKQIVILMRFRCGHIALGVANLLPDYNVCKQLGKEYYDNNNNNSGALQLNLDDV